MGKYRIALRRSGDSVVGYVWFARVQRKVPFWGWDSIMGTAVMAHSQKEALVECRRRFMLQHDVDVADSVVLG